jgi:hypothetical protein
MEGSKKRDILVVDMLLNEYDPPEDATDGITK